MYDMYVMHAHIFKKMLFHPNSNAGRNVVCVWRVWFWAQWANECVSGLSHKSSERKRPEVCACLSHTTKHFKRRKTFVKNQNNHQIQIKPKIGELNEQAWQLIVMPLKTTIRPTMHDAYGANKYGFINSIARTTPLATVLNASIHLQQFMTICNNFSILIAVNWMNVIVNWTLFFPHHLLIHGQLRFFFLLFFIDNAILIKATIKNHPSSSSQCMANLRDKSLPAQMKTQLWTVCVRVCFDNQVRCVLFLAPTSSNQTTQMQHNRFGCMWMNVGKTHVDQFDTFVRREKKTIDSEHYMCIVHVYLHIDVGKVKAFVCSRLAIRATRKIWAHWFSCWLIKMKVKLWLDNKYENIEISMENGKKKTGIFASKCGKGLFDLSPPKMINTQFASISVEW